MDVKKLIVDSWNNTLEFIGPILLVTFVQMLVIIFSLLILAPVTTAGYIHSLLRVVRERRAPEVRDLFSQMHLFLPLFLFFGLAALITVVGFTLLILPGFAVVAALAFAAFYLLPLMTDKRLGLFDALKTSWDMAMQPSVADHLVIAILYVAIMSLGSSLPFAFLLTQPLATFIVVGAYQMRVAELESFEPERPPVTGQSSPPPPPPKPEQTDTGSEG